MHSHPGGRGKLQNILFRDIKKRKVAIGRRDVYLIWQLGFLITYECFQRIKILWQSSPCVYIYVYVYDRKAMMPGAFVTLKISTTMIFRSEQRTQWKITLRVTIYVKTVVFGTKFDEIIYVFSGHADNICKDTTLEDKSAS